MSDTLIALKHALTKPVLSNISYEDFLELGDEYRHAEWVDGEVYMMAAVGLEHQQIVQFLISTLGTYVETKKLGIIIGDPYQMRLESKPSGRQPDVAFITETNRYLLKEKYLSGPADLAVEVISPATRGVDRNEKFNEYQSAGVREYWLIDPDRKQAEFFLLDSKRQFVLAPIGDDGIYHSSVIPGAWLDINWLWTRPTIIDVLKAWKAI
jgi:Uma2 family endonuclease